MVAFFLPRKISQGSQERKKDTPGSSMAEISGKNRQIREILLRILPATLTAQSCRGQGLVILSGRCIGTGNIVVKS